LKQSTGIAASAGADDSGYRASVDAPVALAEVWGDTVDLKHLAWSVVLGVAISVGAFEAGKLLLSSVASDPAIVRADAMLVGLGGCLLAGVVSAALFRPKRIVVEQTVHESDRMDVLARLAEEWGGIGSLADLPASARAELKELGLLDLFIAYEASGKDTQAGAQ
jgi:hypothetical protein